MRVGVFQVPNKLSVASRGVLAKLAKAVRTTYDDLGEAAAVITDTPRGSSRISPLALSNQPGPDDPEDFVGGSFLNEFQLAPLRQLALSAESPRVEFIHTHPYGSVPFLSDQDVAYFADLLAERPNTGSRDLQLSVAQAGRRGMPMSWSKLRGIKPPADEWSDMMQMRDAPVSLFNELGSFASRVRERLPHHNDADNSLFANAIAAQRLSDAGLAHYDMRLPDYGTRFFAPGLRNMAARYPLKKRAGGSIPSA